MDEGKKENEILYPCRKFTSHSWRINVGFNFLQTRLFSLF